MRMGGKEEDVTVSAPLGGNHHHPPPSTTHLSFGTRDRRLSCSRDARTGKGSERGSMNASKAGSLD